MSAFRGILTGFGMAAIKDKEAKDNMRMKVAQEAGIDFYKTDVPEHEKEMKLFQKDYDNVEAIYGPDKAKYFANKGFFGTGTALNDVSKVLDAYDMSEEELKKLDISSIDELKSKKNLEFDKKRKTINEMSGLIGPYTLENQFSDIPDTATQTTDTTTQTTDTTTQTAEKTPEVSTNITSLFTPKASTRGVETKYRQIPIAINEKYGYGENIKMANGEFKFVPTGTLAKTANAHIALAEIISANDDTINQYGAADQAKNMLVNLTEMPFVSLEQTLGDKYEAGDGGKTALMSGAGNNIDANKVQYNGQSISEYLLDFVVNQIPVDPQGNINKAIIDKFIENIPSNLMYSKDESMAERLDRKVKETNFFNTFG